MHSASSTQLERCALLGILIFSSNLGTGTPAYAQLVPTGPEQTLQEPPESCGHLGPALASLNDGSTLATWRTEGKLAFRRIEADGSLGSQFRSNIQISDLPHGPYSVDIAPSPGGGAVVVGVYRGVFVLPLDAQGQPTGPEVEISAGGNVQRSRIVATQGGYTVAWDEWIPGVAPDRLHVRRLDSSLQPVGAPFSRDGELFKNGSIAPLADGSVRRRMAASLSLSHFQPASCVLRWVEEGQRAC